MSGVSRANERSAGPSSGGDRPALRPRSGPWTRADLFPALVCAAFAVPALIANPERDGTETFDAPGPATLAPALLGAAALVGRRRAPVLVAVLVITLRAVMALGDGGEFALLPAALVALYTLARSEDRRRALIMGVVAASIMAFAMAAADADEPFVPELLSELAVALLPVAVADGVRTREERLQDRIESEATARVQAERLRIARDLHDVVAHGLSTIAVQSGVASHLLDRDPAQARASLDIINSTGKQSLEELRAMVGVLRSTDAAPLLPTPSDPDDLSAVMAGARRAGVEVQLSVDGSFPSDASDAAVVAVHRILQEGLTNVARHGRGAAAEVNIEHGPAQVSFLIRNGPPSSTRSAATGAPSEPPPAVGPSTSISASAGVAPEPPTEPPTGIGIVGMTERAESLGGAVVAGADRDGGFTVTATVPYRRPRL